MLQRTAIQSGEATWDDYSFEERTCKGWLLPYLLEIDRMFSGRWDWWAEAHESGKLPDGPLPQICFLGYCHHETLKMLEKCLDFDWNYSRLPNFLEWVLWGFGEGEERPRVNAKINEGWYRMFNLGLMLQNPHDYWGYLYSETKGRGSWNRSGFYPTPHNVVKMMAKMTMEGDPPAGKDPRTLSVCEPCLGTGRMLMETSNYSVNLYGMDIDSVCIAASKVNAYLYIPWLVRPATWLKRPEDTGDKSEKVEPPRLKILTKEDQMKLF